MSSKKVISDQVLVKLSGGFVDNSYPVDERDIWKALEQKLNALFKLTQFSQTLPFGETIPDNLMIATYDNVPVTSSYSGKSKSILCAMPVSLPRGMGINEIRPILSINSEDSNLILGNPFIPLMAGQDFLLQADRLLNDLMGQIGYTPNGMKVEYTKDITVFGITEVQIKLVVFDLSQYGITEALPIPADMEEKIINELVAQFAPVTPESGEVNSFTNVGQNAPKQ